MIRWGAQGWGTCSLRTSAVGVKETAVQNPRIWMVHAGVEMPRTKAGTGVNREILSQVTKFTLNRGYHPQMAVSRRQRGWHSLRAGMLGG